MMAAVYQKIKYVIDLISVFNEETAPAKVAVQRAKEWMPIITINV